MLIDIYVLSPDRSVKAVERFLSAFLPRRETTADGFSIEDSSGLIVEEFSSPEALIEYCAKHPEVEQQAYWVNTATREPHSGHVHFLPDGGMVLGLTVDSHEVQWLSKLVTQTGARYGYWTGECPPEGTTPEFIAVAMHAAPGSEFMPSYNPMELILDRFCGREVHPITKAAWNLYQDQSLGAPTLCLLVEAGPGTVLHDDTKSLSAQPFWEINLVEPGLSRSALTTGATFTVPVGYDESRGGYVTNFYYCEHVCTDKNTIEILREEDTRLLIRMTGETIDVNFYDGSKPPTKLSVQAWFTHDPSVTRSMQ
jgi:hypothetical protein